MSDREVCEHFKRINDPCEECSAPKREGIRPCPFCGKPPKANREYPMFACDTLACAGSGKWVMVDRWNSAYCWREIDRLKMECDIRRQDHIETCKTVDRHRAALEKIAKQGHRKRKATCPVCIAEKALHGGTGSGEGEL